MQFSLTSFAKPVVSQRRFRLLLIGLILFSVILGLTIVPVERYAGSGDVRTWFDGIWWSVFTVTGVGANDIIPVTVMGRIIGMVAAIVGVLAYSLIIAMFSIALQDTRDRYYRMKLFEKLDSIDERIRRLEKNNEYMMKNDIGDKTEDQATGL